MSKLVLPSIKYKKSYYQFLDESIKDGRISKGKVDKIKSTNFSEYIKSVKDLSKGVGVEKGFVPVTEYWLIDNDVFIGNFVVRHKLNKKLMSTGGGVGYTIRPSKRGKGYGKEVLKFGLKKVKRLGFNKVLITCDKDNTASKKIIEANGGVFKNEVFEKGMRVPKLRYWVKLN